MKTLSHPLCVIALTESVADIHLLQQVITHIKPTHLPISVLCITSSLNRLPLQEFVYNQNIINYVHLCTPDVWQPLSNTLYTFSNHLFLNAKDADVFSLQKATAYEQSPHQLYYELKQALLKKHNFMLWVMEGFLKAADIAVDENDAPLSFNFYHQKKHNLTISQQAEELLLTLTKYAGKVFDQSENEHTLINQQSALNEQNWRLLFENSYEGISLRDETWKLIYRSPSAKKMNGWEFEDIIDIPHQKLIHPDDLPNYFAVTGKVMHQPDIPFIIVYRMKHKKGHYVWLETIITNMLHRPNVQAIVFNYRDITERKKIETDLLFSQQQYKSLFDHNPAAVFSVDLNGHFTSVNEVFANTVQADLEQILQQPLTTFIHDEDTLKAMQFFADVKNGNQTEAEIKILTTQNKVVETQMVMLPITVNGRIIGVYGIANDITEKKQALQALQISNERFRYVTKATFDAVWDWNRHTKELYWSEGFKTLFGYKNVDAIVPAASWKNRIHPQDKISVISSLKNTLQSKETIWHHEYRFQRADGTYAVVLDKGVIIRDGNGEATRMIGAMQDISQRKAEEERLKLLESVITNASDGVLITEAEPFYEPHPQIVYVNEAFCKMTGYKKDEIIGKTPRIFQGPKTDRTQLDILSAALKKWQPCEIEIINYKKNGEEYWVNFSIVPVANETGWFTHWIAIERDVTARKQAEEEKKQLIQELTNSNKELKQFSYITSHNMRSPITNLLAVFNLLDTSKIADPETLMLIDAMRTSTVHLNETLNDLISILIIKENINQQLHQVSFEPALNKVIASIASIVSQAGATINTQFSEAPTAYFNQGYMESIFLNLITNAIKYASPHRKPIIHIASQLTPQYTLLTITDNGIGLNLEKVRGKIFGLYQRFHNHPDSKGIGLYLVHSQITALGGTIDIESEEDKGTTFIIKFKNPI